MARGPSASSSTESGDTAAPGGWRSCVVVVNEVLRSCLIPSLGSALSSHHLISTSLIGKVWEVAPHLRLLSSAFTPATSDPQGMVADGSDSLVIADQSRNAIYRVSHLSACL